MANSKFEYVRHFEQNDSLLPNTWIVVRLDGRGFTKFCDAHQFEKPNDLRALHLMNRCAEAVVYEWHDIILAYGQSDEYSKICSNISSFFAANYVFHWKTFFPDVELQFPPTFDARTICYPTEKNLRDYLSWRQADCHINNLYNTCFWCLVQAGKSRDEAEKTLKGTLSDFKNEMLFTQFNTNYNHIPAILRKGTTLIRQHVEVEHTGRDGKQVTRTKMRVATLDDDIISDLFWNEHPEILACD